MTRCACGRTWTSLIECHCATCHRHFTAIGPFDSHRSDDQCHDPATLFRKDGRPRLMPLDRASGVVWVGWQDPAKPAPQWPLSPDGSPQWPLPPVGAVPDRLSPPSEGSHTGEAPK